MTVFALLQVAAGSRGSAGTFLFIAQIALILAIFYFLMIRPQQKQRKNHESTLMQLKKGDDIVTVGGIVGKVVHIREMAKEGGASLTDQVTIQSAESRLVVERGRIARVAGTDTAAPSA
jgi:preprotein translocase subunit YajC